MGGVGSSGCTSEAEAESNIEVVSGPGPGPGNFPPPMPPGQGFPHGPTPLYGQGGPPQAMVGLRSPSEPSFHGGIRKSPSTRSLRSQHENIFPYHAVPPVPPLPAFERRGSFSSLNVPGPPRPPLPSTAFGPRSENHNKNHIEPNTEYDHKHKTIKKENKERQ